MVDPVLTHSGRKARKLTAEDRARFEETSRLLEERIAYHEARAREEETQTGRTR